MEDGVGILYPHTELTKLDLKRNKKKIQPILSYERDTFYRQRLVIVCFLTRFLDLSFIARF